MVMMLVFQNSHFICANEIPIGLCEIKGLCFFLIKNNNHIILGLNRIAIVCITSLQLISYVSYVVVNFL